MFKKVLSLVTILAFLLLDWACIIHNVYKVPVKSVTLRDQIVGLTKISGEYLQFSKENPARVEGDRIILGSSEIVTIDLSDVKDFRRNDNSVIYEINTKDGRKFRNIEGKTEGGKIVFPSFKNEPDSIPLSEVELVLGRRVNGGLSVLATLGIVAAMLGGKYYISTIRWGGI